MHVSFACVFAALASVSAEAWSFKDFMAGDWDLERPSSDGARLFCSV